MQRFSGPALRAARERAGVSREQLALDIGRSFNSIINYERGMNGPTVEILSRLADRLDIEPGDLFVEEVAS